LIRALLIAGFCLTLFGYGPSILDDTRLDTGTLGIWALALATAMWWRQAKPQSPRALRLLWLGLALGVLPFFTAGLRWDWVVGGLADRAAWLAASVVFACALARPRCLEDSWKVILFASATVASLACLQILGLDLLGWQLNSDLPATGSFSNRPQAAEFFVVLLLAGLGRFLRGSDARIWAFVALPAAFAAGYLDITAARIALPLGLGYLIWQQREAWAQTRVAAAAVLLLFVGGELSRIALAPAWTTREVGEAGSETLQTVHGRGMLYSSVAGKVVRTPLGIGLGRFERDYPRWRSVAEEQLASSDQAALANRTVKTPHNEGLLLLLELGWLGGGLVIFALVLLVRDPKRARWTDPALLALALFATFRSPLSDHGPLLAFAVLLLAARRKQASQEQLEVPDRLRALPHWVPCLGLATLAVIPAPAHLFGEILVAQRMPLESEDGTLTGAQPELLARAVDWRPWHSLSWDLLAADLSRDPQGNPLEVRAALLEALRYDSADLFALTALFELDLLQGRAESALEFLWVAEQYAPNHPAVYQNRTTYVGTRGEAYRRTGIQALKDQVPGAYKYMFLAQLWDALKFIREDDQRAAARSLRDAVFYAEKDKGLIERVARDPELDLPRVQDLLFRLLPHEEKAIGVRLGQGRP